MAQSDLEIDQLAAKLAEMMELDPADLVEEAGALAETLTLALDELEEEQPA